jgi:hypothetical protein
MALDYQLSNPQAVLLASEFGKRAHLGEHHGIACEVAGSRIERLLISTRSGGRHRLHFFMSTMAR